jgi:hypothetical protein
LHNSSFEVCLTLEKSGCSLYSLQYDSSERRGGVFRLTQSEFHFFIMALKVPFGVRVCLLLVVYHLCFFKNVEFFSCLYIESFFC